MKRSQSKLVSTNRSTVPILPISEDSLVEQSTYDPMVKSLNLAATFSVSLFHCLSLMASISISLSVCLSLSLSQLCV
jgi:hypothetical protein